MSEPIVHDDEVLTAAKGYIFVAPPGTASPTPAEVAAFDPATGFTTWGSVGHTSADTLPEFGFDGGDTSVLGTWQNPSLRQVVTSAITDTLTFQVLEFNDTSLGLYYAQAASGSATKGVYAVTDSPANPVEKAILVVIVDGDAAVGFHGPKASITRSDSIALATDAFAAFPLQATFLKDSSAPYIYAWIADDADGIGFNAGGTPAT
jgi:hypothetical protein